jgi:hypothetical protein
LTPDRAGGKSRVSEITQLLSGSFLAAEMRFAQRLSAP